MRKFLFLISITLFSFSIKAQVTGSALVCPGYVYNYNVNIVGASTYTWSIPTGWIITAGQGTSQITVLCNSLDGNVCVDGYNSGGLFIAQNCFTTTFGGDGTGWDADKATVGNCICSSYTIFVTPNGSSSPCGGCGSGTLSSNAIYAVYEGAWPGGIYQGLADGVSEFIPSSTVIRTLTVYLIDTTLGFNNAVLIGGNPCLTTINNTVQLFPCSPPTLNLMVDHSPVCVGDTIVISENSGLGTFPTYNWIPSSIDFNLLSPNNRDSILVNYTGSPGSNPVMNLIANDVFGCPYVGEITLDIVNCISPPISILTANDSSVCPNSCITFMNASLNATSFRWYFTGAVIDTSTLENPPPVCYDSSGTFSVTLVTFNGGGVDSLTLQNFITVYPSTATQHLQLINDTLFSDPGFVNYSWYFNNSLITGENQYFLVPSQNGDYSVISSDVNGCETTTTLTNILLSSSNEIQNNFQDVFVYPNPATNELNVIVASKRNFNLNLINNLGQIILSIPLESNLLKIDLKDIQPGFYNLRVTDNKNVINKKIVIQ